MKTLLALVREGHILHSNALISSQHACSIACYYLPLLGNVRMFNVEDGQAAVADAADN